MNREHWVGLTAIIEGLSAHLAQLVKTEQEVQLLSPSGSPRFGIILGYDAENKELHFLTRGREAEDSLWIPLEDIEQIKMLSSYRMTPRRALKQMNEMVGSK